MTVLGSHHTRPARDTAYAVRHVNTGMIERRPESTEHYGEDLVKGAMLYNESLTSERSWTGRPRRLGQQGWHCWGN